MFVPGTDLKCHTELFHSSIEHLSDALTIQCSSPMESKIISTELWIIFFFSVFSPSMFVFQTSPKHTERSVYKNPKSLKTKAAKKHLFCSRKQTKASQNQCLFCLVMGTSINWQCQWVMTLINRRELRKRNGRENSSQSFIFYSYWYAF